MPETTSVEHFGPVAQLFAGVIATVVAALVYVWNKGNTDKEVVLKKVEDRLEKCETRDAKYREEHLSFAMRLSHLEGRASMAEELRGVKLLAQQAIDAAKSAHHDQNNQGHTV